MNIPYLSATLSFGSGTTSPIESIPDKLSIILSEILDGIRLSGFFFCTRSYSLCMMLVFIT